MNLENYSTLEVEIQKILKNSAYQNLSLITMSMEDESGNDSIDTTNQTPIPPWLLKPEDESDNDSINMISRTLPLQQFPKIEFIKIRTGINEVQALIKNNTLDILDHIKVYGGGGGGGLTGDIATIVTMASGAALLQVEGLAAAVGVSTAGMIGIEGDYASARKEALKIPRDQRTEDQQRLIDTEDQLEYLTGYSVQDVLKFVLDINLLTGLSKFAKAIAPWCVRDMDPRPEPNAAPQEQTKSAALTYDSVTGLNVMTENGVVTGLSFDPGGPLAEFMRQGRSSWEILNRMAGEMPSVSNVTLPESSSAAVLPQAAVALVLGAEPPRDPHKVPPQYAYKTHAEAFADLDSAAAGNSYRPVFHSSSDGRGVDPDTIHDLAVSAVRRSFGGGRNLQITFAIDHVTVMAEQSEVNDRINMDRLMEKVEEALAEKLMEAMARGAV